MEDRKLLSLQEIVADIHRSAEEIDEHCGRSGLLGDDGFNEEVAGRSVTAAPHPIASTANTGHDSEGSSTGLPAVTSVSFDIKSEPQQDDDIDGILEDLESYEGPPQPASYKSRRKKLNKKPASSPVSPMLSAKTGAEVPLVHSDLVHPTIPVIDGSSDVGNPNTATQDVQCKDDRIQDAKVTEPHSTISKIESLITRTTKNESNVRESRGSKILTTGISNDDTGGHESLSSKSDSPVVIGKTHLSPTPQQHLSAQSGPSQTNDTSIRDSNPTPSSSKSPEKSVNPISSNYMSEDSENASESAVQVQVYEETQPANQVLSEDDQSDLSKPAIEMIKAECQEVETAEYEMSQETILPQKQIEPIPKSDETINSQTNTDEVSEPEDTASPTCGDAGDNATDDSLMISQDAIQNETLDDSVLDMADLTKTCKPSLSELKPQSENPVECQNSPLEDSDFENTSSGICNAEDSFLEDSLMTSRDLGQNRSEDDSTLDQTDPAILDDEKESLEQDESHESRHDDLDTPLEFTHAFKKDVANYVKKYRSINKASKHFGIPFGTIDIWIRKIFKGATEEWMEEFMDEEPIGETIYTERFKNAVVNYVKRRRCAIEYAAETFNVDAHAIRDWRDNANKEKRQAMLSSIQSPQLMERLGLDLHDIRRRRVAEDKNSDPADIPDQSEGFSDEFISAVVRYVKRRKCSIERASKTLNIPSGILRTWIQSTKAKVKSQKLTSKGKRRPHRVLPQSSTPLNESAGRDLTPSQDSSGQHPVTKNPFVMWKLQRQSNSQSTENEHRPNHQLDGKFSLQVSSQAGSTQKMALQHQGFYHFKRSVIIHARRTNSSILTAKHFGIPVNTVYEWARQDGIELQSVPASQNTCSQEFTDAVRSFARKRKCSLIYAADMFHINPKLIMPWKKQQSTLNVDKGSMVLPSMNSPDHHLPHPTGEVFKKPRETGTKAVERWITQYDNMDPEEFRLCCDELFPAGQSQNRYSREYRIDVMRHLVLKNIGVTETSKLFNMPRRTVYDWLLRWSEVKIRIQKRGQKKRSKMQKKIPPPAPVNTAKQDMSRLYMHDRITESPNDDEIQSSQEILAEPESSSDDPDYDPSKGDLNDNERRKFRKAKNKRRSFHEVASSVQNAAAHSVSPQFSGFHQRQSSAGPFTLEKFFAEKASALFNESPKYIQLRRIVEEAAQQSLVDPSKESEASVRGVEEKLEKWIEEQISLSRTVTLSTMKFYALQFAAQLKIVDFNPTSTWCVSFLQRTGLGSSITYDLNSKMPERPIDDVIAGTPKLGKAKGNKEGEEKAAFLDYHYDQTKGNVVKENVPISELTECVQRYRFEMERSSLVPLPPDMLKTLAGSSSQLTEQQEHESNSSPFNTFEQEVESSNRKATDKTRYVLLKKPPKNVELDENEQDPTQMTAEQLRNNPVNETLISMRGQQFRSRIVAYARKRGIGAAVKNYKVSEKYVRKWMGSQPDMRESVAGSSPSSANFSKTEVVGESTQKVSSIEKNRTFSLPKSSLLKFQDNVKAHEVLKRKSSDSMAAIGKAFSLESAKLPKFCDLPTGNEAKKQFFYLDEDHVFLDHAGKGSRLQKSLKLSHICQEHIESQPQFFHRKQFSSYVDSLQKRFAEFIGSDPADFIFIDTVSSAMETVLHDNLLHDLQLNRCSTIYYLNFSSDETKNAIKSVCERTGSQQQEEILLLPLQSQEDILSVISETLHEGTTLAVFDHCPINFGFMLPVKEITLLCHMKGVPVLINGSHGVGQDTLNLSYLGSDYYVGSCDRWLCSAKGCSFLYMRKEKQEELYGANGNAESPFQSVYSPKDSSELCSCMAVTPALNFWDSLGIDNIRIYCQCLLKNAIDLFQSRWDVELLAPFNMHGMTCCVSLPSSLFDNGVDDISSKACLIEDQLYNEYKIDSPIICVQNKLYVRISVHIYNHLSDFEKLANAIVEMEADAT